MTTPTDFIEKKMGPLAKSFSIPHFVIMMQLVQVVECVAVLEVILVVEEYLSLLLRVIERKVLLEDLLLVKEVQSSLWRRDIVILGFIEVLVSVGRHEV
jgi:hypothetical protein